jgi:hypothetical protein
VLVIRRDEADLVWVVRTGRLVSADVGTGYPTGGTTASGRIGGPGGPGAGGPGPGPGGTPNPGSNGQDPGDGASGSRGGRPGAVAAEVGDPDDLLAIYQGAGEGSPQHTRLWRKSEAGGLNNAGMPLFQQIRSAVDAACTDPGAKP